jgi:hypothetical protein
MQDHNVIKIKEEVLDLPIVVMLNNSSFNDNIVVFPLLTPNPPLSNTSLTSKIENTTFASTCECNMSPVSFNVKDVLRAFLGVWRGINELCKLHYDSFFIETINYLMYVFDGTMVFKLAIKVDVKALAIWSGMHGMDK